MKLNMDVINLMVMMCNHFLMLYQYMLCCLRHHTFHGCKNLDLVPHLISPTRVQLLVMNHILILTHDDI
jgi:hypothetical protein